MSRSKSELSITKRLLLDYIRFKTNNNHQFFASNDYISKALDLTPNSAKVMVNELVRQNYLFKEADKMGRRVLSWTGKSYCALFENVSNLDKTYLKEELKNYKNEADYYKKYSDAYEQGNAKLRNENTQLQQQILAMDSELRHKKEDLKLVIQENERLKDEQRRLEQMVADLKNNNLSYQNALNKLASYMFIKQISTDEVDKTLQNYNVTQQGDKNA